MVGHGEMAEAKARLVERAGGIPCAETEAHHAKLGFVALEDARAAEAAALRLKRLGLLVNVADRPELCDFPLPSILERGPVLVAVSTGGASAGLAKHLRLRLERLLPQNLGALAEGLADVRDRIRNRFPDSTDRRRAIDAALGEGGPLDPLSHASAGRTSQWIDGAQDPSTVGTEEIILRSDDAEDLTLREARLLGSADLIAHEPGVPPHILDRARADAERVAMAAGETPPQSPGLTVTIRQVRV